jgi:hypothetical protein
MAAANITFQVNCNIERRPYLWKTFDHLKTTLSSVFKVCISLSSIMHSFEERKD